MIINVDKSDITKKVVGMEKYLAIVAIENAGFIARIIAEDGQYFIVTRDIKKDRINLDIVDGKVFEAKRG